MTLMTFMTLIRPNNPNNPPSFPLPYHIRQALCINPPGSNSGCGSGGSRSSKRGPKTMEAATTATTPSRGEGGPVGGPNASNVKVAVAAVGEAAHQQPIGAEVEVVGGVTPVNAALVPEAVPVAATVAGNSNEVYFARELEALDEMGFGADRGGTVRLLLEYDGRLDAVLGRLLSADGGGGGRAGGSTGAMGSV